MSILIYCCGPLHPKAMNGVCVGRKKQSLYQTRFSSGQAWKPGEGWEFRDNSNHLQSGILYQIKLWGTLNQNLGKFAQVKCDYFCNNLMSIFFITLLVIGTVDREKYAAFLWILLRRNVSKEVNEVSVDLALVSPCREPPLSPDDGTDKGALGLCFQQVFLLAAGGWVEPAWSWSWLSPWQKKDTCTVMCIE